MMTDCLLLNYLPSINPLLKSGEPTGARFPIPTIPKHTAHIRGYEHQGRTGRRDRMESAGPLAPRPATFATMPRRLVAGKLRIRQCAT